MEQAYLSKRIKIIGTGMLKAVLLFYPEVNCAAEDLIDLFLLPKIRGNQARQGEELPG